MNCKDINKCCRIEDEELALSLQKAGFQREEVIRFFDKSGEEQVHMLKKARCRLMCDIHEQQQEIDKMDYLIREIEK